MKDEGNVADYMASLNRARRRRRNRPPYGKYALAAAVVCAAAAGIFFGGKAVKGYLDKKPAAAMETSGEECPSTTMWWTALTPWPPSWSL